eukprot:CAMPEP_0206477914 /NCGR_PEP_ID=MMETSP0324_2-20121206/35722_1 /ASSEMBLY_ACC=CAM_ASM_000836 /TAXON_ID=2866 /ORGANISM="Crypthecodinium cohnii, Strain Seligo" /LENGTH=55 /DNA_ID=CAMNT_0053954081 /DNA_START=271 /DNA_END=438 /DNA_ORIENTATION=-
MTHVSESRVLHVPGCLAALAGRAVGRSPGQQEAEHPGYADLQTRQRSSLLERGIN